ncbi:hypothetical protein [Limnoglobus roseus]|uniref:Carboxypeptidase regulatory-like domain-containing protein n=1 Tax=Limnoglobus roseus TaxID=2598579 RepID=A0A5C1A9S7_9BACT|nr:hypothetical protein [Limnoglobus roseus]QEL14943.1 carboxypeptidase regulatory-like domain-containing protein [Limnoglobus roseus]
MHRFIRCAVITAGLLVAAGCGGEGDKAKVSGSVTFNGKPVDDGYIVFRAADGKGGEAGAPITSGKYSLSASPGQKMVLVSAGTHPDVAKPMSSEEASKQKVDPTKKPAEFIDPAAKGNNAKIEVKSGNEQSFDFALTSGS